MQENYLYNNREEKDSLAMAYVPWQKFEKIFDNLEKAYTSGTIFQDLDLPFTGRRCQK